MRELSTHKDGELYFLAVEAETLKHSLLRCDNDGFLNSLVHQICECHSKIWLLVL